MLLEHFEQIDTAVDIHRGRTTVAEYMDDFRTPQVAQQLCVVEIRVVFVVGSHDQVAIAEAHLLGHGVEGVTMLYGRDRRALFAPSQEYHGVNEEGHQEIDQHTAHHDEQTLPSRLVFEELVGRHFGFFAFHRIGIGAFVDHAGDFHVTAEGQPTDGEFRAAPCAEGQRHALTAFPEVEEKTKAVHANAEKLREKEVAPLVKDDEQRDAEHQLEGFDQECFHQKRACRKE